MAPAMEPKVPPAEPGRLIRRRARRYRIASLIVLLAGLAAAGTVYWQGTRQPDISNNLNMVGFNRAKERQMAILFGKQGQLVEEVEQALKQPGTQAILITLATAAIAAGLFKFAGVLEEEAP